jgi:hypothetical protein
MEFYTSEDVRNVKSCEIFCEMEELIFESVRNLNISDDIWVWSFSKYS